MVVSSAVVRRSLCARRRRLRSPALARSNIRLRFSEIPNFGGNWTGTIRSVNADGTDEEFEIEVSIAQTWSRLRVRGKTEHGTTRSKLAGIRVEDEELRYEYEAHVGLEKTSHVGFSVLHLIDRDRIEGFYYTLEGFSRKGYVSLQRAGRPAAPL